MTNQLLKSRVDIKDPEYLKSFETSKNLLTTEPLLANLDLNKPFELITDASNYVIDAVLEQNRHPVSYLSRTLSTHEVNYAKLKKNSQL